MPKKNKNNLTVIKGPARSYKTAMLILVANEEVKLGRRVVYRTSDETEAALRGRGLDALVSVLAEEVYDHTQPWCVGEVISRNLEEPETEYKVWRARLRRRKTDV